ncbi:TadB Flp pilus assembly protein TadB [actinobacterium SCGC AAA044-D11]|uniref:Unannotated protein n=1 Tax=freshwater metagenome TaxID=449393 RepID=A0A6J6GK29_9ZZZZ|nr:type II secretion system protein F [Actinomycetota bacterium]
MSLFSLSLLFLSPIIAYATLILLSESKDPLRGFHDDFQKNILASNITIEDRRFNSERILRKRTIISIFISAIALLFIIGASFTTLLSLSVSLAIYWYWEKGTVTRVEKKELQLAEEEFPSIVELFAVLVSAGESPSTALARISERASGELAKKFSIALVELQNGRNLTQALEVIGAKSNSPTIRRFCDTLILAMERGTSLSEVLNRQVEEVRSAHHASLLTAAGKAEIALMIPVIFLILPISVLFALWPSYISLGQSVM